MSKPFVRCQPRRLIGLHGRWRGIGLGAVLLLGCSDQTGRSGAGPNGAAGAAGGAGGAPDQVVPAAGMPGPASGRRLTNGEYVNTVSDLLGAKVLGPDDVSLMPGDQPASGGGFRDDIAGLLPSAVRTDAYEVLATRIAERVAWTGGLAAHATCTDPTPACREGFIRRLGRLMYRRPLTDGDVQNLSPLFDAAGSDATAFEDGARLVLQAMLQSPHFLYRLERIDGVSIDVQPRKPAPTPFEIATRLSYLIWLSGPTSDLLDAAERGDLSTDASLLATAEAMMASPSNRRGFMGYAEDWLQLYRLDARTPNPDLGVTADLLAEMKEETLRFLDRVALTEGNDLTTLFTDKKTELGPALAQVYGISPGVMGFASHDLSNDPNRIGILTQPGFLILRAAPERVTIVHRGLMVMRVFLCTEVPAPPAGAAAQIVNVPANLTDRDRFAMHASSATCKGCHDTFDPLGYPFEPFDLAGRWRTQDQYGNVLRSDGDITLDGASRHYDDTAAFARLLAASPTVQRCLASKIFQYGMGRVLQDGDRSAIDQVAQRFQSNGRTYRAAITSLVSSPAFRAMGLSQ
jgi:hypothetical protein